MTLDSETATILAHPPIERILKPWGEELILNRSADAVVKMLRIHADCRLSLQFHRHKRETLMLLEGEATLMLGPSISRLRGVALSPGVRVVIEPQMLHRLSAGAPGANILEVASDLYSDKRASSDQEDIEDIVRLVDDYGRAALLEQT